MTCEQDGWWQNTMYLMHDVKFATYQLAGSTDDVAELRAPGWKPSRTNFIRAFDRILRVNVSERFVWLQALHALHPDYADVQLADEGDYVKLFGKDGEHFYDKLFAQQQGPFEKC